MLAPAKRGCAARCAATFCLVKDEKQEDETRQVIASRRCLTIRACTEYPIRHPPSTAGPEICNPNSLLAEPSSFLAESRLLPSLLCLPDPRRTPLQSINSPQERHLISRSGRLAHCSPLFKAVLARCILESHTRTYCTALLSTFTFTPSSGRDETASRHRRDRWMRGRRVGCTQLCVRDGESATKMRRRHRHAPRRHTNTSRRTDTRIHRATEW